MRLRLVVAAASAVGLAAACSGEDDFTGFACNSTVVSFDSASCTERVQSAGCTDGGFYLNANDTGCCPYEHCATNPFPEYDEL